MRINKFVALATGRSRRAADKAVEEGRVTVNGRAADHGTETHQGDMVTLDGLELHLPERMLTIMLNKPVGYICSREGQGGHTIYELLPAGLARLKPVGRLDKDSSGLLLMTDDGELANRLTHPRYAKEKVYEVRLDKPLSPADRTRIEQGVRLEDGLSRLHLSDLRGRALTVTMSEGRNRQIRRTFAALGYKVTGLDRTGFAGLTTDGLRPGEYRGLSDQKL